MPFLQAPGIPLAKVYHGLSYTELVGLLRNLAALIIPLFAHRFSGIGSLYLNTTYTKPKSTNTKSTPVPPVLPLPDQSKQPFHIGPIISWPFFGSSRGLLTHPTEINRGPWSSTSSYLSTCSTREISSISILENQGRISSHKLHLSPDEVRSSRYHRVRGPGVDGFDESDESDEWDLEESEEDEWEEGGWGAYRDYRRGVRGAFLLKVLNEREGTVRREMGRWEGVMTRLREKLICDLSLNPEEERFALDCHDLSLENIFVSSADHTVITCIIDWEATTTRPLWAAAHLPSFLRSSVFVARVFRNVVEELESIQSSQSTNEGELNRKRQEIERWIPESYLSSLPSKSPTTTKHSKLSSLAREWLSYESSGAPLRLAHRCVEWDGWEEGLVDSILGPEPEPESEHVGEPEGEGGGGLANPNSDPTEGLVWGWCVHGHGHGHHGEEETASTSSSSRPHFLRSNSSHGPPGLPGGGGGGGSRMHPLFPLVPLQSGTTPHFTPNVVGMMNGIGNEKEKEKDGLSTNGTTLLQPTTHSINKNAKKLNGNEPGGFNAVPLNSSPINSNNNNPLLKHVPQISNAKLANNNNNNNNPKKTPKPPPTASTKTALLLSTQTEQAEKAMEKMLVGTGDICGGRGGELGRRLEAWLVRSGNLGGGGGGGGEGDGGGGGGSESGGGCSWGPEED